jgi:probable phosphoglycerate mutase
VSDDSSPTASSAASRRRLVVEADGGSRGNPGPAAYGTVVREGATGEVLVELAEHIGVASNNVAEYRGVIAGLTAAHDVDPEARVDVRLDSKLIVEQLSGRWQVKHPDMRVLAKQALAVWPAGRVSYTWVPREQNRAADRLVNEALDLAVRGLPWTPQHATSAATDELEDAPPNRLIGWAHDLGEPTTLVLLRHGETVHTRARKFSGSGGDDPPLSPDGEAQAAAAGRRLAEVLGTGPTAVTAVVTSPLQRARQTAAAVAEPLQVPVEVDDGLAECHFGDWEGFTFAEVQERWPDQLAAWLASTSVAPPGGGESFDAVAARVRSARDRLLARAHAGTAIVVSHVTPIKTFVLLALEAPARSAYRMELAPASLSTVLWFDDGNASVRSLNDTQHLDGLLPHQHV